MHDNKYYLQKITPQHKKPKFLKWLEMNLDYVGAAELTAEDFTQAFDLDYAEGKQQDILGDIVGRQRRLNFQPEAGISSNLDDSLYNLLLRAKIGINHWNGTIPGMMELWENLFPEYKLYVKDNQDMSMDVSIVGPFPQLLRELAVRNYLVPKPMGVRANYKFYQFFNVDLNYYIGHAANIKKSYTAYNHDATETQYRNALYLGSVGGTKTSYIANNRIKRQTAYSKSYQSGIAGEIYKKYIGK